MIFVILISNGFLTVNNYFISNEVIVGSNNKNYSTLIFV